MYLHIVPLLFHRMANDCSLKSITIPELNLKIESDLLSTKRPYPNKTIWVGMLKGRKAIEGILLETKKEITSFDVKYQWQIEGMGVIEHKITTYIEDSDFDLVSHKICLNDSFDGWEKRRHRDYGNKAPIYIEPMMESLAYEIGARDSYDVLTEYEWGNFLNQREESLLLHTIQSERLNCKYFDRLPKIENAIPV